MSNSYSCLCDDFYLDMYINTELDLPTARDTILTFFERIQKRFPTMCSFYRRESREYWLEEDRSAGQCRWVALESNRINSGVINPVRFEDAYCQDRLVLELAPFMLGLSHLDIVSLDVTFGMDFHYGGSHDAVIAEALLGSSAFTCLLEPPCVRTIGFSPSVVVALTDDGNTQGRISVEPKTTVYGAGKQGSDPEEAISLSFTVRQYPSGTEKFDALKSFEYQCQLAEELMAEKIVPNFVQPLNETIAQRRAT